MKNLDYLKNSLDQYFEQVKGQIETIQNDLRTLPGAIQQVGSNTQIIFGEVRMKIEEVTDKLTNGDIIKKNYGENIQKAALDLQNSINKILDSIKESINKAR